MRLENILALTNGEIVNKPFVKKFSNISYDAKAIKRGDLFVAFENEDIEEAILNGAYGIVFCKPTQITDAEIAWIKVKDIEDALKKLIRFYLLSKDTVVYQTDEITLKLAKQTITETNFVIVDGDIKDFAKLLLSIEENSIILFCPTLVDKNIFATIQTISETDDIKKIDIVEQTLFETSFIYDDIFYERQLLSPFFIPYLEKLLHFYKTLDIGYRLKKFTQIDNFEAVFINKKFEIKDFGTTDIVLIFEKDLSLYEKEVLFLKDEAPWAKKLYLAQKDTNLSKNILDIIQYQDKNEVLDILKECKFHFALIIGVDKSILDKQNKQDELSLFNF